jgi:hypothetical protein
MKKWKYPVLKEKPEINLHDPDPTVHAHKKKLSENPENEG